jgi:hypothetical protein
MNRWKQKIFYCLLLCCAWQEASVSPPSPSPPARETQFHRTPRPVLVQERQEQVTNASEYGLKGDGVPEVYCPGCARTETCDGRGRGAFARRINNG